VGNKKHTQCNLSGTISSNDDMEKCKWMSTVWPFRTLWIRINIIVQILNRKTWSGKVVLVHEHKWIKGNKVNDFKITNHKCFRILIILYVLQQIHYYLPSWKSLISQYTMKERKHIDYESTTALIAAWCEFQFFTQWLDFSLILNCLQHKVINWIQPQWTNIL
jgi:hypothetical protein